MAIHKLADGPITLTIANAEITEGKFGAQYQVTGYAPDGMETRVYVSQKSFEQQLSRLKIDPMDCSGETLHFEQVKKDGTTYTNINRGRGMASGEARQAAPAASAAPASKITPQEAGKIYSECVTQALLTLGARCEENGIALTAEALQSAAATLFIKVTR